MKNDYSYFVYGLVIVLLVVGIFLLLPRQKLIQLNNIKLGNKTTGVIDTAPSQALKESTTGEVKSWDGLNDKLSVLINGKVMTLDIDPTNTEVMIGISQNKNHDTSLFVIDKDKDNLHWMSAFCPTDSVNIQFENNTNKVTQVVDATNRDCGFKGDLR